MNPDRWREIEAVFQHAADLPTQERAQYLEDACGTDSELRAEVESLLAAEGLALVAQAIEQAAEYVSGLGALEGQRIGAYQVLAPIGEGGMGTVYKAVRADGQFDQQVAIKIIRPGVAGAIQSRRFIEERSMLAQLQHPNIARLIDGGEHSGIPYIVMELVDGLRIDQYCRQWSLSVREKLELFLKVCDAVQHAHAALIVHRDLKPSNILVTAEGDPKLLDFGIATLVDTQKNLTQTGWMMTPDYASPEQVNGEGITVASDVYSLGIVLHELLTGQRPYKIENYSPAEIQRVVCTTEIAAPSNQVGLVTRLKRQIEGDLDNILLMALRKEPTRRYGSVAQFAEDIRRHLGGETVIARPDTMRYRLSKFVGRNRIAIGLGSMLILAVLIGAGLVVREGIRAQRRFDEVRSLANSLLTEIDPEAAKLFGSAQLRRLLIEKSLAYLDRLSAEAGGDVALQKELARAYHRIGDIFGHGRIHSLGLSNEALESHLKGILIEEPLLERYPNDKELKASLAMGYAHIGDLHSRRGDGKGAERFLQKAYGLAEKTDPKTYVGVRASLNRAFLFESRFKEGLKISLEGIEVANTIEDPNYAISFLALAADIAGFSGNHQLEMQWLNQAVERMEALTRQRALDNDEELRYANLLCRRATALGAIDSPNGLRQLEALPEFEKAAKLYEKFAAAGGKTPGVVISGATNYYHLALVRGHLGRKGAVEAAERGNRIYESMGKGTHPEANYYLGYAYFLSGGLDEAQRLLETVAGRLSIASDILAEIEERRGNNAKAIQLLARARNVWAKEAVWAGHFRLFGNQREAANLLRAVRLGDTTPGLLDQADALLRKFPDQEAAPSVQKLRRQLMECRRN